MNSDVLKPEHFVPVIDPPERLSQKNTKQFLVLYRGKTTMSCSIEVELGHVKVESDRVVHFSCSLFLVLQILVAHGFVDFSNTGIVSVPEKPDLQSFEPGSTIRYCPQKGLYRHIYKRLPVMKRIFATGNPRTC